MSTGRIDAWRAAAFAAGFALFTATALAQEPVEAPEEAQPPVRPNFLIVILDDIGFTDLGAYGSEMRTPHIDAEAERGLMFSGFRAGPTCAPTRAMLMTGVDSHLTGVPTLEHLMLPEQLGQPGHEGELNMRVATIAEHLSAAGYASLITGKWHLGRTPTSLPSARGFARSFILDSSGADNWEHRTYLPHYTHAEWWEDGAPVYELPEDFYSSAFLVDRMIDYLDEVEPDQPFFSVLSFQANHIPLQAPREYVERYDGVYDAGWEALAAERHAAAVAMGLVPEGAPMPSMPESLQRWSDLSEREQRLSAMSRQVAAGMLEAADHHFGRLVERLRETGRYDDTVIVILSDNGAEFNDPARSRAFLGWLALQGYSRDPERLGERRTYTWIGPEWAAASSSPLSLFKFHAAEGGVRVPLIISGPGVSAGGIAPAFTHVTDIAPTLIELAGAAPVEGREAFSGRSLSPLLSGAADHIYGPHEAIGSEMSGQSALYRGDYKLTRNMPPFGDRQWRLFNLAVDPGETRDLSAEQPELMAELMAAYEAYERRVGVLPVPANYDAQRRLDMLGWRAFYLRHAWVIWLSGFVLLGLIGGGVALLRRGRRQG
ncbi:MAG: arylsulfatase [Oceanicaulis sp.]